MDTLPDRSVTHVGKLYCHLCRRVQHVANADSNTVSVIDGKTNTSMHSFTPIQSPSTTNRSTTKTPASGDSDSINEGNDLLNQIIAVVSAIERDY